jgi:hypothetical protein
VSGAGQRQLRVGSQRNPLQDGTSYASHRPQDLISPSPSPSTSGQVLDPNHMQVCCIFPAMGLAPCSTAIYFSGGTLW